MREATRDNIYDDDNVAAGLSICRDGSHIPAHD